LNPTHRSRHPPGQTPTRWQQSPCMVVVGEKLANKC